jgi:hypothetical protein
MESSKLKPYIDDEIRQASALSETGHDAEAFSHLERAHVLGQAMTREHTRVHWLMFRSALRRGDVREIWGQLVRIIGAATKTPLGIYPTGNTGGSNVWFFKPMPVPEDLKAILDRTGK